MRASEPRLPELSLSRTSLVSGVSAPLDSPSTNRRLGLMLDRCARQPSLLASVPSSDGFARHFRLRPSAEVGLRCTSIDSSLLVDFRLPKQAGDNCTHRSQPLTVGNDRSSSRHSFQLTFTLLRPSLLRPLKPATARVSLLTLCPVATRLICCGDGGSARSYCMVERVLWVKIIRPRSNPRSELERTSPQRLSSGSIAARRANERAADARMAEERAQRRKADSDSGLSRP